ncbi:MAG: hypothetical protein DRP11_01945 [Candidatus Aenigmatarchaeota archaeon]|nr:MAG: hypothetical protein DRP11_01945 [Candidatus Aenigmarchaeota archaeon]
MLWIEKQQKQIIININDNLKEKLKLELEIVVWDKNGKIIKRHRQEVKSWLKNFALFLKHQLHNENDVVVDTGGASATIICGLSECDLSYHSAGYGSLEFSANAGDNDDSFGIIVGSGTATVSPDDYNLASKIPHGTGSGQLDYDTHTFESPTITNGTVKFSISRSFKNSSGGDVNVNEVGLVIRSLSKAADKVCEDVKFLIIRDVLDSTVTVPDGGGLTVKYTISTSSDFVVNFIYLLYALFSGGSQDVTDTDGTSQTIKGSNQFYFDSERSERYVRKEIYNLIAGDDNDTFGVVVGSDNSTAWDVNQYNLASKISHGTGSGQLDYGTHSKYDLEELSDRFRIKISRSFYNGSGGQVSVGEIGLIGRYYISEGYSPDQFSIGPYYFMILRKVLSSLVTVDPEATLVVNYYIAIPK